MQDLIASENIGTIPGSAQTARSSMRADAVGIHTEADAPWWAVYTRHQHEKVAGDMLARKGFEVFLPLYQSTRRWKDRFKTLSLPLFPSYVFIRGGIERQLQVVTTPGIVSIVTAAGRVATIPDREIDAVRRMLENSLRVEPHLFLRCGDQVDRKSV